MPVHSKFEMFEDNWRTSMGGWSLEGEVVLRGRDVFTELNHSSWMEYLLFAVTGKESPRIARLMEGMWVICTSFPDPRIWNNRVSALAGTTRSTGVLAAAASVAVTEATLYGLKPIKGATDFFYRADGRLNQGENLEQIIKSELKQYRSVYGYGRPIVRGDERVEPMMAFARSIGCGEGKFIKIAFEVAEYLSNSRLKYQINIAAVCAALLADEGLSPMDFYHMATLAFTAGAMPCFIDALDQPEGCFFPLRTSRLNYTGGEEIKHWRV
jgi:citrate synthase